MCWSEARSSLTEFDPVISRLTEEEDAGQCLGGQRVRGLYLVRGSSGKTDLHIQKGIVFVVLPGFLLSSEAYPSIKGSDGHGEGYTHPPPRVCVCVRVHVIY